MTARRGKYRAAQSTAVIIGILCGLLVYGLSMVPAAAEDLPLEVFVRPEPACGLVSMGYDVPEGARVEIWRSINGGPEERQPELPIYRSDVVPSGATVVYRVKVGATEKTAVVTAYACGDIDSPPTPTQSPSAGVKPSRTPSPTTPPADGPTPTRTPESTGGLAKTGAER